MVSSYYSKKTFNKTVFQQKTNAVSCLVSAQLIDMEIVPINQKETGDTQTWIKELRNCL